MPSKPGLDTMNRTLEAHGELPMSTWHEWLWKCDPQEPLTKRALLNKSHMLGMLLCRFWATATPAARAYMQQASVREGGRAPLPTETHERVALMAKKPEHMTLRELRDTVDNLVIELPTFAGRSYACSNTDERITAIEGLADESFARLGVLASTVQDETVMNDPTSVEQLEPGKYKLTKTFMRRSVCIFLALFRNIHMWKYARRIQDNAADVTALVRTITKHHVEASNEDFHLLCMHHTLPIGATLAYKVDFPGMFNHVSQVVYFNNAKYERQRRPLLDALHTGDPLHCLAAIMQLHPDIEIVYETDHTDLTSPKNTWRWAVFPGMVYLVDPRANIYHSPNIMQLYLIYSKHKRRNEPKSGLSQKRPRVA